MCFFSAYWSTVVHADRYSAFKNTDGSYAFVIINKSSSDKNIVLTAPDDAGKKHSASCTLQPRSVNSFKWK